MWNILMGQRHRSFFRPHFPPLMRLFRPRCSPANPHYIETCFRRGYRFGCALKFRRRRHVPPPFPPPPPTRRAAALRSTRRTSFPVRKRMPFALSPSPERPLILITGVQLLRPALVDESHCLFVIVLGQCRGIRIMGHTMFFFLLVGSFDGDAIIFILAQRCGEFTSLLTAIPSIF